MGFEDNFNRAMQQFENVPEMQEVLANARNVPASVWLAFQFIIMLVAGVVFSTLGGVLGAVVFKKNIPPPAPPPVVEILPPE
jgi:hypothetical protein